MMWIELGTSHGQEKTAVNTQHIESVYYDQAAGNVSIVMASGWALIIEGQTAEYYSELMGHIVNDGERIS